MTTFAYDVPGYVQGHRFSQDSRYYDAANTRFNDLAGFNRFNSYVEKTAGSAAFSNHGANSREGLLLDNTNQWQFVPAIPWEGTVLLVLKPVFNIPTNPATRSLNMWIFGDSVSISSNAKIRLTYSSGVLTLGCDTASVQLTRATSGLTNSAIMIAAFSTSQSDRKMRVTQDGITVSASSAASGTTTGSSVCMGSGGIGNTLGGRLVRLGNNSGTVGDTAQNTADYLYLFEQHFFKGDQLTDNLAAIKNLIDSLKSYYAIT